MNRNLLIIFLLLCLNSASAQSFSRPKKIKEKGDYTHIATGVVFPVAVGDFERISLTTFDKKKNDVDASYEFDGPRGGKTKVTVFVYPGGDATDSRFRDNFLAAVLAISYKAGTELQDKYTYCPYTSEGYKINGFRASFLPHEKQNNWLELYECGKWLLKIRITTDCLDSAEAISTSRKFVEVFNPVKLLKVSPLKLTFHTGISENTFADKMLLGCTYFRAKSELLWVKNNIDSLERIAGFPSLYLDMYAAGIYGMLNFADTVTTMSASGQTKEMLDIFRSLKEHNLLSEYLVKKNESVMIVPEGRLLDFKAYDQWVQAHKLNELIQQKFYQNEFKQ